MKKINLENVEDVKEFKALKPGGYVIEIKAVTDVNEVEKPYLILEYDFIEGDTENCKDYYSNLDWNYGKIFQNYGTEWGLKFFKQMINKFQKSNDGFKFDFNEQELIGKRIGATFGNETYLKNNGELGTRLYFSKWQTVQEIENGAYRIPSNRITQDAQEEINLQNLGTEETAEELPF